MYIPQNDGSILMKWWRFSNYPVHFRPTVMSDVQSSQPFDNTDVSTSLKSCDALDNNMCDDMKHIKVNFQRLLRIIHYKSIEDSELFLSSLGLNKSSTCAPEFMVFVNHGYTKAICKVHEDEKVFKNMNSYYFRKVTECMIKMLSEDHQKDSYTITFAVLFALLAYIEYCFNTNCPHIKDDKVALMQRTMTILDEANFFNMLRIVNGFNGVHLASTKILEKRRTSLTTKTAVTVGVGMASVCGLCLFFSHAFRHI